MSRCACACRRQQQGEGVAALLRSARRIAPVRLAATTPATSPAKSSVPPRLARVAAPPPPLFYLFLTAQQRTWIAHTLRFFER
eukprot:5361076-Pleurochrysis_carterae.AAC.1